MNIKSEHIFKILKVGLETKRSFIKAEFLPSYRGRSATSIQICSTVKLCSLLSKEQQ